MRRFTRSLVLAAALAMVVSACADTAGETTTTAGEPATTGTEAPPETEAPATTEVPATTAPEAEAVTLTVLENAVRGGANSILAQWYFDYAIPTFEEMMAAAGTPVTIDFIEGAVGDVDYKTQLALDLSVGAGADVFGFDQFWTAEFAAGGLIAPLSQIVGPEVDDWEGWDQIPDAVAGSLEVDGERYGVPFGTDGRVLFYRIDLFEEAGLDTDWQPTSWEEILETARTIQQELPDVTPLQINAGTADFEATTLQGFMPLFLGTGRELYQDGAWQGDTPELRETLEFYQTIYSEGLADADLQLLADGRDQSFQRFSEGNIAILAESDFFWRGVIAPEANFPIPNREEIVGYTKVPAMEPGTGIRGQDFVSASGGTGRVMNPNTEHAAEAWAFMMFVGSEEAMSNFVEVEPRITGRNDVNATGIAADPMLTFVAEEILPITWYRPGFEEYPQVSESIARMVENVVAGRSTVEEAAQEFHATVAGIVGDENVAGG